MDETDEVGPLIRPAFAFGSAQKNDILAAVVAGRGESWVLNLVLKLPERRYLVLEDALAQMGIRRGLDPEPCQS